MGVSVAVMLLAATGTGLGFRNGDAAAYVAQAWAGAVEERLIHVGYLAIAVLIAPVVGEALPMTLDFVSVLAAGTVVAAMGAMAARRGESALLVALATGAVVVPEASFAEVDLPWVALLVGAAWVRSTVACAALVVWAVAVSPVAVLALPWIALERRRDPVAIAVGGGVAVLGLSLLTGGEWWSGDRGVLTVSLAPGRSAEAWLAHAAPVVPLMLVVAAVGDRLRRVTMAVTLPLVLAPPDIPAWLPLHVAVAAGIGARPTRWAWAAALVAVVLGTGAWSLQARRVRDEDRVIRATVAAMSSEHALIAPWSWGVRASVIATGDPYALPWRTPGTPVRDQGARFCNERFEQVAALPPGWVPGDGVLRVDASGVAWGPGAWVAPERCQDATR